MKLKLERLEELIVADASPTSVISLSAMLATISDNNVQPVRQFEFGTKNSAIAAGYTKVLTNDKIAVNGDGWKMTVNAFDTGNGGGGQAPALTQDFHWGSSLQTFQFITIPGINYSLRGYFGDPRYNNGAYKIAIRAYDSQATPPSTFTTVSTTSGGFNTVVLTGIKAGPSGIINLDIVAAQGGNGYWVINGLDVFDSSNVANDPTSALTVQPPLPVPATRRFDLNAGSNATAPGFIGVRASDTIGAKSAGWKTPAQEFDTGNGAGTLIPALYQDFHWGSAQQTFQIAATPGVTYDVRVYVGDPRSKNGAYKMKVRPYDSQATPPSTFTTVSTTSGGFNTVVLTGIKAGPSGIINLDIVAAQGGNSYWVMNGVDIWDQSSAANDPAGVGQIPTNISAASSTGALSQKVNQASTSTTVTPSLSLSVYGQSVTFTASVTSPVGAPTGTVQFFDGTNLIGTGTLSGGIVRLPTAALTAGSHTISAVYPGDINNSGSTAAPLVLAVNPAAPTVSVTGGTFVYGSNGPAANATATGGGGAPVSGSFSFTYDGSSLLPTNAGTHVIVASFTSNDPKYNSNATGSGSFTINSAVTSTSPTIASATITSVPSSTSAAPSQTVNQTGTSTTVSTDKAIVEELAQVTAQIQQQSQGHTERRTQTVNVLVTSPVAGQALVHVEGAQVGSFVVISRDDSSRGHDWEWKRITITAGANDISVPLSPEALGLQRPMNRETHVYFYDATSVSTDYDANVAAGKVLFSVNVGDQYVQPGYHQSYSFTVQADVTVPGTVDPALLARQAELQKNLTQQGAAPASASSSSTDPSVDHFVVTLPTIETEDLVSKLLPALNALMEANPALKDKVDRGLLSAGDILGQGTQALSPTDALARSALQGTEDQLDSDILDEKRVHDALLSALGDHTDDLAAVDANIQDLTSREQIVAAQLAELRYASVLITTSVPLSPQQLKDRDTLSGILNVLEAHSPIPRRSPIDATALQNLVSTSDVSHADAMSAAGTITLRSWQGDTTAASVVQGGQSVLMRGAVNAIDLGGGDDFISGMSGTIGLSKSSATATLFVYRGEQQVATASVRDGESFTFVDPQGITALVTVSSSDVRLSNLAVIDRRDLLPLKAAPVDIATNRQVAIASAHPVAFDNGIPWWWKTYARINANGEIYSSFGYYVTLDSTKYTRVTLSGGDGNAIFSGLPVSIKSTDSPYDYFPHSTPLDPSRYETLGKNMLVIYPGTPGVLWIPVSSYSQFTIQIQEGDSRQDVLPPSGVAALAVNLANRRAQGNDGWGDNTDLKNNQVENAVGSFSGRFDVHNNSVSGMVIDQVIVHSGPSGSLQDPVVHTFTGTSIRAGQVMALYVGVPEGQTVNGVHPRWTIGFVIGGKEYAMTNGSYRYSVESGSSAAYNDQMWSGLSSDHNAQVLLQKITTTITNSNSNDSRIVYARAVTGNYQVAFNELATHQAQVVPPSQLTAAARTTFLTQFLGTEQRDAVLAILVARYQGHGYDLTTATGLAQTKLDIAVRNPQLLLPNLDLSALDHEKPDVGSVLNAAANTLVPEAGSRAVAIEPDGIGGGATDGIVALTELLKQQDAWYSTRAWYSVPLDREDITGVTFFVDRKTVVGQLFVGVLEKANTGTLAAGTIADNLSLVTGIPTEYIIPALPCTTNLQDRANALRTLFETSQYGSIFQSSLRAPDATNILTSVVAHEYHPGDPSVRLRFDYITPTGTYDHGNVYAVDASGIQLPTLLISGDFRYQLFVEVPVSALVNQCSNLQSIAFLSFKFKVVLSPTAGVASGLQGANTTKEAVRIDLTNGMIEGSNLIEKAILADLATNFPLPSFKDGGFQVDFGSPYHFGANFLGDDYAALDIDRGSGTADKGDPIMGQAGDVISDVRTNFGAVVVSRAMTVSGTNVTVFVEHLHTLIRKKTDEKGTYYEVLDKNDQVLKTIRKGDVLRATGLLDSDGRDLGLLVSTVGGTGSSGQQVFSPHDHLLVYYTVEANSARHPVNLTPLLVHFQQQYHWSVNGTDGGTDGIPSYVDPTTGKLVHADGEHEVNNLRYEVSVGMFVNDTQKVVYDRSAQESAKEIDAGNIIFFRAWENGVPVDQMGKVNWDTNRQAWVKADDGTATMKWESGSWKPL